MDTGSSSALQKEATLRNVELREFDNELRNLEFDSPAKQDATEYDIRDMDALGLVPTFKRRFKFIAMVGFCSTVVVGWQNTCTNFGFGLFDGGTGGIFWTFVFSLIASTFLYLTLFFQRLAANTRWGADIPFLLQAECAPIKARNLLSYITGWLLCIGWQTTAAGCGVIMGNLTKYCILLYWPDSTIIASQWFPTVLAIIFLLCGGLFNVYLTRKFAILEGIMLTIHWAAWIAIVVTLWVTSPRGKASEVLFTFTNSGGWPSGGVATLAGVLSAWSVFVGYDSSVHMTENAKDASKTIPFSMGIAFVIHAVLAFIMAITLIFCVGDVDAVVAETTLTPFVVIFRNATGSKAATVVMVTPIILTFWSALISQLATASRQLWAFARDGGVPWAHQLAPVHDFEVPRRAVWVSIAFTCCISLINFGPVVGFNAIVSLVIIAITSSYTICIATLIWRRCFGKPIPRERFSLGKPWGMIINIIALCCTAPLTVMVLFPPIPDPSAASMNWAILVFGVIALFSGIYYAVAGRKTFNPPMRKDECLR
ncbi:hypothetical protein LTR74_018108 [Friedmanniomyces endolithicus]|nr:hypothetical protein LTR74_018108 [Friedmanniomyces endolithicus]